MSENARSTARYSYGGDEQIFVQLDEEMSLQANFRAMAIAELIRQRAIPGIVDVCPANASYQVLFDPDVIHPQDLMQELQAIDNEVGDAMDFDLTTRIIEVPVYYNDPWTYETLMRFRDRHQSPETTDLEYAARINGLDSVEAFIEAHSGSPWFTSMVGFVAGLPFLFQMTPRERQLEVPKYLRPRTDTPALTIGHGGCFSCIYSVRGAGGYQMFGITPAPIFDPEQRLPDFADFMIFFNPGDIVKFRPIDREEYDEYRAQVEDGAFRFHKREVHFKLSEFLSDPDGYNRGLMEALNGN
ncbi:MAG: allophanate hydrolase subunit 1 [Chloroflexi bacterium]|nr:allophanate hydrolase subunit 1 [Chloroflexota bacterium]